MGADEKRGELDKISRAQAINKAASEKAEKEKVARRRGTRRDAAAEGTRRQEKQEERRGRAADVVRRGESRVGRQVGQGQVDGDFAEARHRGGRGAASPVQAGRRQVHRQAAEGRWRQQEEEGDGVHRRQQRADRHPGRREEGQERRRQRQERQEGLRGRRCCSRSTSLRESARPEIKHETPEWAKPEIRAVPTAAPVVARPQPKRDDGIIHVVQGAAPTGRARRLPRLRLAWRRRRRSRPRAASKAGATARGGSGDWDDPFSESTPRREAAASRNVTARSNRAAAADFDEDEAPAPRRGSSVETNASRPVRGRRRHVPPGQTTRAGTIPSPGGGGNRKGAAPAARGPRDGKPAKSTGSDSPRPARGGAWKDPFTEAQGAGSKRETALTKREAAGGKRGAAVAVKSSKGAARNQGDDGAKWESAGRKSPSPALAEAGPEVHARWGAVEKRWEHRRSVGVAGPRPAFFMSWFRRFASLITRD